MVEERSASFPVSFPIIDHPNFHLCRRELELRFLNGGFFGCSNVTSCEFWTNRKAKCASLAVPIVQVAWVNKGNCLAGVSYWGNFNIDMITTSVASRRKYEQKLLTTGKRWLGCVIDVFTSMAVTKSLFMDASEWGSPPHKSMIL